MARPSLPPCVGIFVGGASRRMGQPKGLLLEPPATSEGRSRRTLVERLAQEAEAVLPRPRLAGSIVLVGARPEYQDLPWPVVPDVEAGAGPLGGLVALLAYAEGRGDPSVLALACDQPYVTRKLLDRLLREEPQAAVCAPKSRGYWQPLCARYDVGIALPAARRALSHNQLTLQRLLDELGAAPLELSEAEERQLVDWDSPEDVLAADGVRIL